MTQHYHALICREDQQVGPIGPYCCERRRTGCSSDLDHDHEHENSIDYAEFLKKKVALASHCVMMQAMPLHKNHFDSPYLIPSRPLVIRLGLRVELRIDGIDNGREYLNTLEVLVGSGERWNDSLNEWSESVQRRA